MTINEEQGAEHPPEPEVPREEPDILDTVEPEPDEPDIEEPDEAYDDAAVDEVEDEPVEDEPVEDADDIGAEDDTEMDTAYTDAEDDTVDDDVDLEVEPVEEIEPVEDFEDIEPVEDFEDIEPVEEDTHEVRWNAIQMSFVDDPRQAVDSAGALVAQVLDEAARTFAERRQDLESQWQGHDEVPTDELREAFREYRDFFQRVAGL